MDAKFLFGVGHKTTKQTTLNSNIYIFFLNILFRLNMSYEIKFNSRNKKYMVFRVEGTGFGSWKIIKGFPTEKEAKKFISDQIL